MRGLDPRIFAGCETEANSLHQLNGYLKIKIKIPGKNPEQARNTPGTPLEHLQDTRNSPEQPHVGPDPDPSGWPMSDLQYFQQRSSFQIDVYRVREYHS